MAGIDFRDLMPTGKDESRMVGRGDVLRFDDLLPPDRVRQGFEDAMSGPVRPELQQQLAGAAEARPTGGARSADGGIMQTVDAAVRGAADAGSFGFADEIAAGISTGAGMFGDYGQELQRQRAIDAYDAKNSPWARLGGQLAGGVAGAVGLGKAGVTLAPKAAGMTGIGGYAGRIGLGAAEGAGYGAGYGFGSSDGGIGNRAKGAVTGATIGAITGGAVPAVTGIAKAVGTPIVNAVTARTNPTGYAASKVSERLAMDNTSVNEVARNIGRAKRGGDAMAVSDVAGENTRGLLRTASNVPGPGREAIKSRATLSTLQQGDRLKSLVSDAFGSDKGDAYQAAKATVMQARSEAAKPFYDAAYARPIPYSFKLEEVLNTPAGKAALATAKVNSLNRREPWAQWFASIDDAGNIIDKRRVPDTRALDETQRVLRGMVEAAKKPADGSPFAKALDTPQSIALRSVLNDLTGEMDKANPAFAKARSVAMDNIQADEALEFGRNALTTDARVNARKMGAATAYGKDQPLNEGQKELARFGLAEALRKKIDDAGMTHNAILKFFSTREQIARIRPFFKSNEDWKTFRDSIINEARKRRTYNAVTGNSTTARQLADMQDAGGLNTALEVGGNVIQGRFGAGLMSALKSGISKVGGLTPETADQIARMLMTRDTREVQKILIQVRAIERSAAAADRKQVALRTLLTNFAAGQGGNAAAQKEPLQITVTRPSNWDEVNPARLGQ
jgi:hypothetical protein